MYTVILLLLALAYATGRIMLSKHRVVLQDKLRIVLLSLIVFNIGFMGLIGFAAHYFMPNETARMIGWAMGSPFQTEMAFANLAMGVLGILSPFFSSNFWLATVMSSAILILGAASVHIDKCN